MKKTILLVDDETDLREVLDISLSHSGYNVLTAENGTQALSILNDNDIPVVITDIKMPGIDGIELLRKIKNKNPEAEVIMLTGHGDLELAIKSLKHEATDFITKPINDDALEIALQRAFEKIQMRQKLKEYHRNRAMYDLFINELIQEDVMIIGSAGFWISMKPFLKNWAWNVKKLSADTAMKLPTGCLFHVPGKTINVLLRKHLRPGSRQRKPISTKTKITKMFIIQSPRIRFLKTARSSAP